MGIPRLFKIPRHKQFNYQPIYFNPAKEELEERIERIKQETGQNPDTYKPSIHKGQMRGYFRKTAEQKRKSNIRLIIIFITLALLAYYLIYA